MQLIRLATCKSLSFPCNFVLLQRGNFGVDLNVPWSAGEKHDPTFDVSTG